MKKVLIIAHPETSEDGDISYYIVISCDTFQKLEEIACPLPYMSCQPWYYINELKKWEDILNQVDNENLKQLFKKWHNEKKWINTSEFTNAIFPIIRPDYNIQNIIYI